MSHTVSATLAAATSRVILSLTVAAAGVWATAASLARGEAAAGDGAYHGWYAGTMQQALDSAKASQKPLFVVWSAVWCPPCNELKAHVFNQPKFTELMHEVVPVYLDGDSEDAQRWADRLHVSGYPTMVLLGKNQREVTRFTEVLDVNELGDALTAALADTGTLTEALARAQAGKASPRDWQLLATFDWEDTHALNLSPAASLRTLRTLANAAPKAATIHRAQLAAKLLEAASADADAADGDAALAKELATVKTNAPDYIGRLVVDHETVLATRSTLLFAPKDIVSWAFPSSAGQEVPARAKVEAAWLAATDSLKTDAAHLSILHRLYLPWPRLAFNRLDRPSEPVPAVLADQIKASAVNADKDAANHYERHAVIDEAASLLVEAGDFDGAKALLTKEIEHTDTPWYYQASMAELEQKRGNDTDALAWSARAKASARGNATRLQWISFDAQLAAKAKQLPAADRQKRILADAQEFYQAAVVLPDGFAGRSAARAAKLAVLLRKELDKTTVENLKKQYAPACTKLTGDAGARCQKHFDGLAALTGS